MPALYPYLIASLPMLQFGAKPDLSLERFLEICRGLIPDEDCLALEYAGRDIFSEPGSEQPTLKKWRDFETGLRNELVNIRASRKKVDPAKYRRTQTSMDTAFHQIALNSHRIPSPLEAEKFLDWQRWDKLEELCLGHYFDLDALIVYYLKLRILWRWEKINRLDKEAALERALEV